MVLGHRFGGAEALATGLVDDAVAEDEVLPRAIALASAYAGHRRDAVFALKRQLYAQALTTLGRPTPPALLQALFDLETGKS